MTDLFFRNRRLLALAILLILVAGLAAFQSLPRLEDPELTQRFARITTRFPGATAERVEALVTKKIEEELFEIEELKILESESVAGLSAIVIELQDKVDEVDEVWSRVRDKLDDVAVQLPVGSLEPEFEKQEPRAYALITALSWDYDSPPNYAILRRLAEELKDRLRAVHGTEKVELFGDPQEEITVEVDPTELAARGVSAAEVSRQIAASDAKLPAGQLRGGRGDLPIEIENQLDSIARVREIPIRFGANGQTVELGDIAQVKKDIARPQNDLALIDGQPAVALGVWVDSDQRIDWWAETARAEVEQFGDELPEGVRLSTIFDQSRYTTERLDSLMLNLVMGAGAVLLVVLFMMGWRSALVVGSALPLTALMVFTGMHWMGIPLHQMSVSGLIIALGLLIDNAIVMVDEVRGRLRKGIAATDAIGLSVRHLAVPLAGSTITTALAFMPIALMPGGAGEFVGAIAVSVILAIFSSLFLAMTVIPALAGLLDRLGPSSQNNVWWNSGFHSQSLLNFYRRSLDFLFARPALGIMLGIMLPTIGFYQARMLEEQFFPPADRDMFQVELELPAQASIAETRRTVMAARDTMLSHPEVTAVHWFIGESAPSFYYNLIKYREHASQYAQAMVCMRSADNWREVIHQLQADLDTTYPNARVLVRQLEQGPPFKAPIEVRLYGPDLEQLRHLGNEVRGLMAELPDTLHTAAGLADAQPKIGIQIDEEEARLAGLSNSEIARQLDRTLEGSLGGSILEATEELPVRVRLKSTERADLNQIASMELVAPSRQAAPTDDPKYVPLESVGQLDLVPELSNIPRRNARRVNTVQAYITAGVLPEAVLDSFKERLAASDFALPPGYTLEYGGETAQRDIAVGNLMSSVGVLMVLMGATLVLSFGSFRLAGIIAAVGGLSVGLGLFALWLFGIPFGFMAIVGTMGLVGVAINDSIVVLASLRENRYAAAGDRAAIREVVVGSTRHVLSTTITTMAGFTPLLIAGGGFWPPMAIAIAGGVSGSTILALYFVPSAFLIVKGYAFTPKTQRRVQQADEHSATPSRKRPTQVVPAAAAARQISAVAPEPV